MSDRNWIILLVLLVVVYKLVNNWTREIEIDKKFRPSPPPSPKQSEPWSHIHRDFADSFVVQQWQQLGYDYQETKQWIKCGVKPDEPNLVQWIKGVKKLDLKDIGQQNKIHNLRYEWQVSKLRPGMEGYF